MARMTRPIGCRDRRAEVFSVIISGTECRMLVLLLAHIGTPLLAGLVVLGIVVVANQETPDWMQANEAALDLTILSIGATGPLLLEPGIRENFRPDMAVYGILLVLSNLLIACILVGRKKWKKNRELTFINVWPDLLFGVFSVAMTTGAFYAAYNPVVHPGGQHA